MTFCNNYVVGTLNMLSNKFEINNENADKFMWWGAFVVITQQPHRIRPSFSIVENFDQSTFLIKINDVYRPILIASADEKEYFLRVDCRTRLSIYLALLELKTMCEQVFLACNIVPLKLIELKTKDVLLFSSGDGCVGGLISEKMNQHGNDDNHQNQGSDTYDPTQPT